jgi:hypothetical protein
MSGILQIVTSSNDEVITLNRHLGKCDLSLISAEMLVSGTQGDVARVQIEFLPMWKNVDVPQTFSVKFFNDLNQGAIPSPNFDAALLTFSYSLRE